MCSNINKHHLGGRFGMRNRLSQSVILRDYGELLEYLKNETIDVTSFDQLNEEYAMLTYKTKDDYVVENSSSNIVISMFVTSYARWMIVIYVLG